MTTKNNIKAKQAIRKITGPISFGEMLYSFRLSNEYGQVAMAEILGIIKQELCNIEPLQKHLECHQRHLLNMLSMIN